MKLAEICRAVVDCEHKTAPIEPTGEFFAVGTPAMRGNVVDYSQARRISPETFAAWTQRLRPKYGDLLLAREAPVGPVVSIPREENVAPGQRTVLLRPNPAMCVSRFLLYYLGMPTTQGRLNDLAAGSTVAHLNVADVRDFEVELPDLATQTAIADVLGALDDKIAANERVLQLGDDLLRSRFAQLVNSAEDWVPLSHYLALRYGKSLPSNQRRSGEVPVVGSGGPSGMHDESLVEGPGVVVGRKGSIGTVWWCDRDFWPIDTAFFVEPVRGTGLRFAYALLRWMQLGEHNGDSAVPGLNRDVALAQPVPRVGLEEAEDFEASATPIMDLSHGLQAENARLAATRDALLPELMSGRLSVKRS